MNLLVIPAIVLAALVLAGFGNGKAEVPPRQIVTAAHPYPAASRSANPARNVALNVPVTGSGGFNYTQGSYLEGFEFTVNRSLWITKLGAYDSNLSSLANGTEAFAPVPVAVYDMTSKKLLGTVSVSASDPATGVYRYAALKSPIALNKKHKYAVAWVSLSNYYVASPALVATDVNSAINYLAMVGNGPGGLTTTDVMVRPNWFYTKKANGLHAINYDLGPNFMFSSTS